MSQSIPHSPLCTEHTSVSLGLCISIIYETMPPSQIQRQGVVFLFSIIAGLAFSALSFFLPVANTVGTPEHYSGFYRGFPFPYILLSTKGNWINWHNYALDLVAWTLFIYATYSIYFWFIRFWCKYIMRRQTILQKTIGTGVFLDIFIASLIFINEGCRDYIDLMPVWPGPQRNFYDIGLTGSLVAVFIAATVLGILTKKSFPRWISAPLLFISMALLLVAGTRAVLLIMHGFCPAPELVM